MKQFKLFIDLDKEENYLNEMAKRGWIFDRGSVFGIYHFTQGSPSHLEFKVDYRTFKRKEDFNNYVALFEDAGYQHVWGNYYSGNQYFLPKSKGASRDIFSDRESKAQRYIRLQQTAMFTAILMTLYAMIDFVTVKFDLSQLFFLTPGLWEMEGAEFWRAYWFEFPFMLMRVLPVVFLAVVAIINAVMAVRAKQLFNKAVIGEEN